LISGFPSDGVVTVNRVILKEGYTVDDLQERGLMPGTVAKKGLSQEKEERVSVEQDKV
jgi:hypothetical protein